MPNSWQPITAFEAIHHAAGRKIFQTQKQEDGCSEIRFTDGTRLYITIDPKTNDTMFEVAYA